MEKIAYYLNKMDDLVWGPWMLILLIGTGIYLMLILRFLPVRNLKKALLSVLGKEHASGKERAIHENTTTVKGVSSFSALTTELAATIGTGNIVGVSSAMVLGGPGALFWMILAGILGMAIKLTESTLSVKHRCYNDKGAPSGGPMYVLKNAFPNKWLGKLLSIVFAFFAVLASFGMGNMTQSNAIADAMYTTYQMDPAKTGLVITIATILVVLGGIKRIASVTRLVVPFMGTLYIAGTLIVIMTHWQNIPMALMQIITMAFCPEATVGGAIGTATITMAQSMRWGISRGVFSNEAGLGVSGISAAAADTTDPVRQGYISMTGVFLDTIIICSMTGLAFMTSGVFGMVDQQGNPVAGIALTIAAFRTSLGEFGAHFVCVCIVLFAFATIVGWAYQGEKAFEYLVGKSSRCIGYRFVYGLMTFVGAVCSLEIVWDFSDICNGLLVIPNLIGVWVLSKGICLEIRDYDKFY